MNDKIAQAAAKILLDTESVLFNAADPFTYTSGKKGPVYVDIRRLISFPEERAALMTMAENILKDKAADTDYVAGGETAGIPYAAFIAERLNLPMLYVRKKPKGFGRMAQIEGHIEGENKKVLLVEDMVTDGGSKRGFVDALREAGNIVEHIFVVFHYGIHEASKQTMQDMEVELHALCTWWDILAAARDHNYFDVSTLDAVESFLHNPQEWQEAQVHKEQAS